MAPSSKARASKSNGTTPSDTSMTDHNDRINGRKAAETDDDSIMVRPLPPILKLTCLYAPSSQTTRNGTGSSIRALLTNFHQYNQDTPDYSVSITIPSVRIVSFKQMLTPFVGLRYQSQYNSYQRCRGWFPTGWTQEED